MTSGVATVLVSAVFTGGVTAFALARMRRRRPSRLARLLAAHEAAEREARAGDAAAERLARQPWGPPGSDWRRP